MKKIVMAFVFAIMAVTPLLAQTYQEGTMVGYLGVGGALPTNKIDGPEGNVKWGKFGPALEVGGMYYFTENIGAGLHFGYNWFGKKEGVKVKGYNLMLDGKYVINPEADFRFYVPVAVGFMKPKIEAMGDTVTCDMEFAWNAGLGAETTVAENIIIGLDVKYNGGKFKKGGNYDISENMYYVSAMLKVGYKF